MVGNEIKLKIKKIRWEKYKNYVSQVSQTLNKSLSISVQLAYDKRSTINNIKLLVIDPVKILYLFL